MVIVLTTDRATMALRTNTTVHIAIIAQETKRLENLKFDLMVVIQPTL